MSYELHLGDAIEVMKGLRGESVQTCVTSPPYFQLRSYLPNDHENKGMEIGSEPSVDDYVEKMVAVFREVKRVLRDDGTVFLNLGDSYAGSGGAGGDYSEGGLKEGQPRYKGTSRAGGVGSNLVQCLMRSMKGQPLILGNAATIRVSAQSRDVPLNDNGFPYGVLLSLLGVERITIKQRDNNFRYVLHTLATPSYCWINCPIQFVARDMTDLEIVLDAGYSPSIVIANHDANGKPVLGMGRVSSMRSGKHGDSTLAIKESREPITESIIDGQSYGNPVAFDAPLKCFPNIYLVDQAIAFGDGIDANASGLGYFGITQASEKQLTLTLGDSGVNLTIDAVGHLSFLNAFGSVVRYSELYHNAIKKANTLQPKQELGIPDLVKRALMEDGWICRSTIIWHKKAPMPESVTDRPTKAHEQVFLLSKAATYYYDAEAIKEPATKAPDANLSNYKYDNGDSHHATKTGIAAARVKDYRELGRNKRSVWTLGPESYAGAHFATMPTKLVEPCILAGTSAHGCCAACGSPWARITESISNPRRSEGRFASDYRANAKTTRPQGSGSGSGALTPTITTLGWAATCTCNAPVVPCTVLDPFSGAATVGVVALKHHRNYVGIDLNADYLELSRKRIEQVQPMLLAAT